MMSSSPKLRPRESTIRTEERWGVHDEPSKSKTLAVLTRPNPWTLLAASQHKNSEACPRRAALVFLEGVHLLVFRVTIFHKLTALVPGEEAPRLANVIAMTSLFLGASVIWFGRG